MSTLTYFKARPDYGMGRAFLLAFAVHAALIAVMMFGLRWQSHPGDTVSVELWEPPPPPAPPPPPKVEAPKPPPPPPPKPEPKPEPEVKKPEIVEKAPPPKPKPKPEPKPEPKPAPKDDERQKRLIREQLAQEQRQLEEERRRIEEQRRVAEEARRKAEAERIARELAATARNKALNDYVNLIRAKVRRNWILPQDLQGNPEAVFRVVQLPTGEVLDAKLVKSSGNPAYDDAVYRAILKSSPLPLPASREHFYRELELTFRPRD